jgi:hypothetical protein
MRSVLLKGINLKIMSVLFCLAPALGFAQAAEETVDGIEPPPPAASIDDYLIYLFVLALVLAVFFFMKTNGIRNTAKAKFLVLFVFLSGVATSTAQVQNNGTLHAADNGIFYVASGNFNFGASAVTSTTKSATNGKISLGQSATFVTDGTKFVNGYAETRSTVATVLSIGTATTYAPVRVLASANTNGVQAAYINAAPLTFQPAVGPGVTAVANTEYWIVKGENAKLSLSWRASSGLSSYVDADVTIIGYNEVNGYWEPITSTIDDTSVFGGTSSLAGSGSITSTGDVTLASYSAFAIGQKGIAPGTGTTITWNGTAWSGGIPTVSDAVVLSANYSGGSFACNSLNLNGFNVTLTGDQSLEIVNGVSGTGTAKVIMSSESSLVQRNSFADAPAIELTKATRPMRRFDYVYWGQPVTGNVYSQLDDAIAPSAPSAAAFDSKYKYVSGITNATGGWQNLTATIPGQGYIMRVKPQAPFTGTGENETSLINLKFTGTANNGDITVPIANVPTSTTSARNNNLLANPYPSAIDAKKFLTQNTALVDGVIYLWRAVNTNSGAEGAAYTVADYIAYTQAGSAGYSGAGSDVYDGKIASGQVFKVKAIATGTAVFTNSMRELASNTQFYRSNTYAATTTDTKNRFKLNLKTDNGIANEILIAYLPETSLGYDNMYDAELVSVSTTKMFSMLDNTTKQLVINARPDFTNTDQVALGITVPAATSANLQIALTHQEGVFANNQTPVYLHDAQANVYHDFANGAYSFTANNPTDTTRFKIVYQNEMLNTPGFQNPTLTLVLNHGNLSAKSSAPIESLTFYDLTGRVIENHTAIKGTSFSTPFNHAQSVYIVKIIHTNGVVVNKKVFNTNN